MKKVTWYFEKLIRSSVDIYFEFDDLDVSTNKAISNKIIICSWLF